MIDRIVRFLQGQLGEHNAIIGLSGGVDSAVVASLLALAIPPKRIYGYSLPSQTNAEQDIHDAEALATQLGIHFQIQPIDQIVSTFPNVATATPTIIGNIKARVRMTLLYQFSNQLNGVVVGTGNKSELQLGYFTKYGDGGVDILPIAHLYKTAVWELAKELQIPASIIEKPPTAGLWNGQTDEAELGISYTQADQILAAIAEQRDLTVFSVADVTLVQERQRQAKHKLTLPPHL